MKTRQKAPPTARLRLAAGGAVGAALALVLTLAAVATAGRSVTRDATPLELDATHVPPLLTALDEPVHLAYDLNCASDDTPEACEGTGTVYLRRGTGGPFTAYTLAFDRSAPSERYKLAVPDEIAHAADGFSYYAVLRESTSGGTVTIPAGGADAPDTSVPLDAQAQPSGAGATVARMGRAVRSYTAVRLGRHRFGATRRATARVAEAPWGDGPTDVGLENGPESTPIGASSFDVTPAREVVLLDEAHKRLLRWRDGEAVTPTPVAVTGAIADITVGTDGSTYVLESAGDRTDPQPTIRHFDADGRPLASWHAAERSAAAIRIGPHGPTILTYPSSQWLEAADGMRPLAGRAQTASGMLGRPFGDGSRVLVLRTGNEVRLGLVRPNGTRRTWRIASSTPVAEVQLATPYRNGALAVFRTYTDTAAEFVVVKLDRNGIADMFSLPTADWAETAPLSRFRLVGDSLYQLGSSPSSVFVDRYDLGG
jgi:hypothetical protein